MGRRDEQYNWKYELTMNRPAVYDDDILEWSEHAGGRVAARCTNAAWDFQ